MENWKINFKKRLIGSLILGLILLLIALLFSCSNKDRYEYYETYSHEDLGGVKIIKERDPITITADNDTAAYIMAYDMFKSAVEENVRSKRVNIVLDSPIDFKLINFRGENIVEKVILGDIDKYRK